MPKVYAVLTRDQLEGVFSTRDKAEAFRDSQIKPPWRELVDFNIVECDMDVPVG